MLDDDPRRTCLKVALSAMWAIRDVGNWLCPPQLDMEIEKLIQKWIKCIVLCTQIQSSNSPP